MKRSMISSGWVLVGLASLAAAALGASAGSAEAGQRIPGIGPGTGVDVYIPNPDPQTPIAWSQGTEPPPPQGDYGGGSLQYMITGNETRPAPRPGAQPPYFPQRVAPVRGYDGRTVLSTNARPMEAAPAGYAGPAYRARGGYSAQGGFAAPSRYPAPGRYAEPAERPSWGFGASGYPAAAPAYGGPAYRPTAYRQEDPAGFYGQPVATYAPAAVPVQTEMDPAFRRQEVAYSGGEGAGTIVIDTASKFLYFVEGGGRALRYGIGVGRPGFLWAGTKTITRKAEWPDWTPPSEMLARRPDLPRHMEGGIANPLGARAMYLGSSLYRIHGTNEPNTIGTNVSSGCIRLVNDDVADLYSRVEVGTRVIVM